MAQKDKKNKKDKKGNKKKVVGTRVAQYDAADLAVIRWLAMEIEQAAISAYITDPTCLGKISKSMQNQVKELRKVCARSHDLEGDCPAGWIDCDGLCAPMCGN